MNAVRRQVGNGGTATVRFLSAGALVVIACWPASATASDEACTRTSRDLPVGSMAFDMVGTYRIQFIGTGGRALRKQVAGTLTLKLLDPEATRVPVVADSEASVQRVLSGTLNADLDRVGGMVPGPENRAEVTRTMVEVAQWDGLYENRPLTEISMNVYHVGKPRHSLELIPLRFVDGASFGMLVRRIDATGFRGTWNSTVGMTTMRASGHFCAWRVPKPGT